MVRMKDIAQLAGVNITTVSKALRGSSDISKETITQIKVLANQLGYKPKHVDKKEKSGIVRVGLVCPAAGPITNGLVTPMQSANCEMVAFITNFDAELEKKLLHQLEADDDVNGIIYQNALGVSLEDIHVSKPMVAIGPGLQSDCYDVLKVDEVAGYRQAMDHLVSLGHRRFGFIGDRYCKGRLGYVRAEIERRGLELPDECIVVDSERRHLDCGYHAGEQIAKLTNRPTAILAQYDDIAFGAIGRMRELGIRVPEDISIVGFDDMDYCGYFRPKLSSISNREGEVAEIATKIMKRKICNPQYEAVQTVEIKSAYYARESVAPPRTK